MYTKELFGHRLKLVRKGAKEKQEDLAEILGIKKSQVSEIENGNNSTTVEKVALICEHYRVSADYLLGLTDEP